MTRGAIGLALGVALTALVAMTDDVSGAAADDYVGATTCQSCHAPIYSSWAKTAHATGDSVPAESKSNPRCQGCHMTGNAPAGISQRAGVQCEACHGAGLEYAADDIMRNQTLSRSLGLLDLSTPALRAAVCKHCHRADVSIRKFDAAAAWKRIAH